MLYSMEEKYTKLYILYRHIGLKYICRDIENMSKHWCYDRIMLLGCGVCCNLGIMNTITQTYLTLHTRPQTRHIKSLVISVLTHTFCLLVTSLLYAQWCKLSTQSSCKLCTISAFKKKACTLSKHLSRRILSRWECEEIFKGLTLIFSSSPIFSTSSFNQEIKLCIAGH